MAFLMKGALIEYGSDFLGPLPNVVVFQFNPEQVTRTLEIPQRPAGSGSRETSQAGEVPLERLELTAKFSASDMLGENNVLARASGVGTYLAALELMANPKAAAGGLLGAALDAVGDLLGGGGADEATQPIPREAYPRLIFIWGVTRVLPVMVTSLQITETHFDFLLNPIEAEAQMGLTVIRPDPCSDDVVATGATVYTATAKEALAVANLANVASEVADLVAF
jgi:hypothetical protein